MTKTHYDAIVIGGGHAGVEAARALLAREHAVALLCIDPQKIGALSCNPAVGGVAKGHLVYEIDALGGLMGRCADMSSIQSRRLNMRRGPAVRSTRVQCDKDRYPQNMQALLEKFPKLDVIKGEAENILVEKNKVAGVLLSDSSVIRAPSAVISAGTFMRGLLFCGSHRQKGGRYGDKSTEGLSSQIAGLGHSMLRLKTGTPPRLDARTIAFSRLEKQWGDPEQRHFSWRSQGAKKLPQLCCYMTYTNERTHEIIRSKFEESPLFSGDIQGAGPRYCPSIEDKVRRFADRPRHQIFLEPEGLNTHFVYPNGMSTSLSEESQLAFMRSIVGLEKVEILRAGYAVEYDSIDARELNSGLMSKLLPGLFFAGQVNRSSGYEEAAAQGLWAGLNASLFLLQEGPLIPLRERSYIETLVDDLVSRGTIEPYRLFTSRSEYRLLLREDNAQERLYGLGRDFGLISAEQSCHYEQKRDALLSLREKANTLRHRIDRDRVLSVYELLRRPDYSWESLSHMIDLGPYSSEALEGIEIEAKYSGYLKKQESELKELEKLRAHRIDIDPDLMEELPGLSSELREKIKAQRPKNLYDLSMIGGVTPAALILVARRMEQRKAQGVSRETRF